MQDHTENRAYAGFFVRLIAFMIDSLFAFITGGIVKLPFGLAAGAGLSALKANFIFQHSFIDVIGYLGMVAYFILMTYFTHSTLGKKLFRLEVVTLDGNWTFINILYRETIGRFLSGIMSIGYLAILISSKKQGFHDMLCDTCVVYKDMQEVVRPVNARPAVAGGPDVSPYVGSAGAKVQASRPDENVYTEKATVNAVVNADSVENGNVPDVAVTKAEPINDTGEPVVSAFFMPEEK